MKQEVSIIKAAASAYPPDAPYHPDRTYPEYPFPSDIGKNANHAYDSVRNGLHRLGLDETHFDSPRWNPLGALIEPGDHVLIKPNLIAEGRADRRNEWEQVITHPSMVRAVVDYVSIALKGSGRITIADGPQTDSDFDEIVRRTRLDAVVAFFREKGLDIHLLDLRRERWLQREGVTLRREPLPGDPVGYVTVRLDAYSAFRDYALNGRFYGADYDFSETARYHSDGRHSYVLCRTVMDADVVINLPKMKTHKKTGVTLSLKNMVGINGYRNCLPHHTIGTPDEGGDEFSAPALSDKLQSRAIVGFKKALVASGNRGGALARTLVKAGRLIFGGTNEVVRSGNWFGNDTTWRMVLDLNKALFHFSGSGERRAAALKYMTIIDGIVAGEGNGPVSVDAKPCGTVVSGFNPVAVDTACALIMGFDYCRIPLLRRAWEIKDLPLTDFAASDVRCHSNVPEWNGALRDLQAGSHLGFRPHFGWVGHIERISAG